MCLWYKYNITKHNRHFMMYKGGYIPTTFYIAALKTSFLNTYLRKLF